jgi:membrane fusion protein, copper/silver efflux system
MTGVTKMGFIGGSTIIAVWLTLNVLSGCESPLTRESKARPLPAKSVTLVRQNNGSELIVIANPEIDEGPIASVEQVALPSILEAAGVVTFDDKLVSTISSRLTGRVEEVRISQWETVLRDEPVMSLFSPDYMSAEEEYLAASADAEGDSGLSQSGAFGLPAGLSLSSGLKEAAIRKLELLGFSPAAIAAIHKPSSSVWVPAPISGIVVSNNVVRGQQVNPGDQLFALATLHRVWITANVYEDDIARVTLGQRLEAVTASFPQEIFTGTVQRISPALDPTVHTLQLRCEVENPRALLKPQMLATVRLRTSPRFALVIPQIALVFDDNAYFSFLVIGTNAVERRQVQVADWDARGYARIVSGLKPGDRVLTTESLKFNELWHEAHAKTS